MPRRAASLDYPIGLLREGSHGFNRYLAGFSLVAATPDLREEALFILRHREAIPPFRDFAPGHERIAGGPDDWRSFFFYGYGYAIEENLLRCPRSARALQNVPQLVSAMFSIIGPGAHIRRHRGVTKAIMTAHLPLIVPKLTEKCRMEVGDQIVPWEVGTPAIFDDTYFHEVWNDTDEIRAVLLIQFRRPMRQPGRLVADAIVGFVRNSSFVQRARRNLGFWEQAYAEAEIDEPGQDAR